MEIFTMIGLQISFILQQSYIALYPRNQFNIDRQNKDRSSKEISHFLIIAVTIQIFVKKFTESTVLLKNMSSIQSSNDILKHSNRKWNPSYAGSPRTKRNASTSGKYKCAYCTCSFQNKDTSRKRFFERHLKDLLDKQTHDECMISSTANIVALMAIFTDTLTLFTNALKPKGVDIKVLDASDSRRSSRRR
ncbi:hypothetical protein T09_15599 [Trichinella sp. T9]|nr:hypothetical protein T09_15599 [Trichinella sp. T9]